MRAIRGNMETKIPYNRIVLYHNAINKNRVVMNDYVMISLLGIQHSQMIAYTLLHGLSWMNIRTHDLPGDE